MTTLFHNGRPVARERDGWRTKAHGTLRQRYEAYLHCANDGKGGDVTRNGAPLLTFDEWLNR